MDDLKLAEDELIKELGLLENDDPPCVGGPNFNVSILWGCFSKRTQEKA